jgi:hypothetical protein
MPALLLAAIALAGCGAPAGRVVHDTLGTGPRLPPAGQFDFSCSLVPTRNKVPPAAVVALCGAQEAPMVQVTRVPGGMRVGIRFTDLPRRALQIFLYPSEGGFDRGAHVVTRVRRSELTADEPESGWIVVQHFDRSTRSVALQFSLRFPGIVVNGGLRKGEVPLPPPPPPAPRPDPWHLEADAGPARPQP